MWFSNRLAFLIWLVLVILIFNLSQSFFNSFVSLLVDRYKHFSSSHSLNFKDKVLKYDTSQLQIYNPTHDEKNILHSSKLDSGSHSKTPRSEVFPTIMRNRLKVVLAAVACGDRLHEALVMIKSAILFSNNISLKVVVFSDKPLIKRFEEKLDEWRVLVDYSFTYEIHPVKFPEDGEEEWCKLFKPCAAQRLFLPSLLKDYDSVLYVDTDTLFLAPLEDIWQHFERMDSSQIAALAPEHEDPTNGWYNRFAKHPFYGKLGVNSGVMLMNLTRMRQFGWELYLSPIYKTYRSNITFGDQDIINIIFHHHPESLYVFSCRYNYRADHCVHMSVCRDAHAHGVAIVHGSRGAFHSDRQKAFKAIFSAMEEYQLGTDAYQHLLLPLENRLVVTSHTNCGNVLRNIITRNLHLYSLCIMQRSRSDVLRFCNIEKLQDFSNDGSNY